MSTTNESEEKTLKPSPNPPASQARVGPRLELDEYGHAIPLTEAERKADLEAFLLARAERAAMPDDPLGSDEEFWRAIDAGRPERPLFRKYYTP